jgi:hypothetical protein
MDTVKKTIFKSPDWLPKIEIFNKLTAKDCFPILNYIAFFILYIVCFVYINVKYSEIVGFGLLFVIHTAFSLFISKDIFNLINEKMRTNLAISISLISIIVALLFHFVSFILTFTMITTLQTKYTKTRGTPIVLSKSYKNKFENYKRNIIAVFSLSFIILMAMFFAYDTINIDFNLLFKSLSVANIYKSLPAIFIIMASFANIGISSHQVYISNMFSKLSKKDLI